MFSHRFRVSSCYGVSCPPSLNLCSLWVIGRTQPALPSFGVSLHPSLSPAGDGAGQWDMPFPPCHFIGVRQLLAPCWELIRTRAVARCQHFLPVFASVFVPAYCPGYSKPCSLLFSGVSTDWAFGPKPEEEKAVMAEGTVPEVEWLEEDGVLVEGKPEGEGAGTLPGMEIPLGLLTTAPRSSISFADSHKKRFF
ncbi:small integral membrane protein 44 isoform X1 [Harpia harpyja]|uniref:small integral membrane protein 44 isoform X1 n=1 Tax=Harpia harpyja TaxID=202280 RepID=UPI0022B0D677|nr:small integral membrane protein 44 isoform X1 [Harpia harpyja]